MEIRLHESLSKALTVVDIFNTQFRHEVSHPNMDNEGICARCFDNGREQGITIRPEIWNAEGEYVRTITIAQNRNSDGIVIYNISEDVNLYLNPNEYPDDFWASAKHFGAHEYYEAAKFIKDIIQEMVYEFKKECE